MDGLNLAPCRASSNEIRTLLGGYSARCGGFGSDKAWRLDLGRMDNVIAILFGALAPPGSSITLNSVPWLWRPWTATKNR